MNLCQLRNKDFTETLKPGDIIRIGHVMGRDYVITSKSKELKGQYPTIMTIEPKFGIASDLDTYPVFLGNSPWIASCPIITADTQLPTLDRFGLKFAELPKKISRLADMNLTAVSNSSEHRKSVTSKILKADDHEETGGEVFENVWLWKCIPGSTDRRPTWRRMFDNGEVAYEYLHANSPKYHTFFRVSVSYRLLEVLCTDSRIPDLAIHAQRIDEMNFSLEHYVNLAYQSMLAWFPRFNGGVDISKFIKFIRLTKAIPDMKKRSRMDQIELGFIHEMKGKYCLANKYVTFQGFKNLIGTNANHVRQFTYYVMCRRGCFDTISSRDS